MLWRFQISEGQLSFRFLPLFPPDGVSARKRLWNLNSVFLNLKLRGSWVILEIRDHPYAYSRYGWNRFIGLFRYCATTLKPAVSISNTLLWEKVTPATDVVSGSWAIDNRLEYVFDWCRRDTMGMLAPGSELPRILGKCPYRTRLTLGSVVGKSRLTERSDGKSGSIGFNLYDAKTKIKYNNETGLVWQGQER